jgi:hypothetical protein
MGREASRFLHALLPRSDVILIATAPVHDMTGKILSANRVFGQCQTWIRIDKSSRYGMWRSTSDSAADQREVCACGAGRSRANHANDEVRVALHKQLQLRGRSTDASFESRSVAKYPTESTTVRLASRSRFASKHDGRNSATMRTFLAPQLSYVTLLGNGVCTKGDFFRSTLDLAFITSRWH